MSWWTDIRDAVTSPFRAVGSFVQDIANGQNFFESLGRLGAREFFALNPLTAVNAPLVNNIDPAKKLLENDTFNSLTGGIGKNIANVASFTKDAASGRDFSYLEARDAFVDFASANIKGGAAVLAAGAAPAGASAYTQGAAAYTGLQGSSSVLSKIEEGDYLGAITSGAGQASSYGLDIPVPDEVQQAIDAGKAAKKTAEEIAAQAEAARRAAQQAMQSGQAAQGLVDLAKSNTPPITRGYSSTISGVIPSGDSGSMTPILLAGGALLLILMKGRR